MLRQAYTFAASPCKRDSCTHAHLESQRHHQFCCNACRKGETMHTRNCTGSGKRTVGLLTDTQDRPPRTLSSATPIRPLQLPVSWMRGDLNVLQYIQWFATRYHLELTDDANLCWSDFMVMEHAQRLFGVVSEDTRAPYSYVHEDRQLSIYAYAQDNTPGRFANAHVNVAEMNLNAYSDMYNISDVTGVDFRVQAVVAMQAGTATALFHAFKFIERSNAQEFAFVCHGGTHRSVACCFLLAALAYPQAQICLTTRRTQQDAGRFGLYH